MLLLDETIKVGKPSPVGEWSHQEQRVISQDPYEVFVGSMTDKKITNWKTKTFTQTLFPVTGDIAGNDCYHQNYLGYLEHCWKDHLGAVITPDIIWYTLLCELAILVKAKPEDFRSLFTTSTEKKKIFVQSDSRVTMPLDMLVEELKHNVPTDTDRFMPTFSTSNIKSVHAFHAAFCDMVSPYYDYMMMLCGIPYIDVRGEKADYMKVREKWGNLVSLFPAQSEWTATVYGVLAQIEQNFGDAAFWKDIFHLERCGSGGQTVAGGWWKKLFREQPSMAKICNFPTHVSDVEYEDLPTKKNYVMKVGLLASNFRDDLLVPDFGHVIYEKRAA